MYDVDIRQVSLVPRQYAANVIRQALVKANEQSLLGGRTEQGFLTVVVDFGDYLCQEA